MATIYGSCTGSNSSKYNIWLDWSLTSQSITNNTSTINVKLYVKRNDGYANSAYNLNGQQYRYIKYNNSNTVGGNGNVDTRNSQSYLLQTANYTISHNADGSKSITLQGGFNISGVSGLSGGSVSGSITLPQIQRASQPSVNSFTLGDLITINTNRTYSGFTHTIRLVINGITLRTLEYVDTSVTIQLTDEEIEQIYNSMPSSQSCTVQVQCTTYNGSTTIGTNTTTSTCSIDKSICYPTFPSRLVLFYTYWKMDDEFYPEFQSRYQIVDGDTIISGFGRINGIHYRVEDSLAKKGASITKLRVNIDGNITEYSISDEILDFGYIDVPSISSSEVDLVLTVVDSRGLETSKTYTLNKSEYQVPKISSVQVQRDNGVSEEAYLSLNASIWNGEWFNDELTDLKNEIRQLQFRYLRENTESASSDYIWSSWYDIPNDVITVSDSNTISVNNWLIIYTGVGDTAINFPVEETVQYQVRLTDGIYRQNAFQSQESGISYDLDQTLGTATFDGTIDPGKFLDVITKDRSGDYHIGFGGMPDDSYLATFHGDVNIQGGINNIVYETTLTAQTDTLEITDLSLSAGEEYEILINGTVSENTDVGLQVNNIASTYWQMGRYYTNTATANINNFTYTTGLRTNTDDWYYAHSMRTNATIIKGYLRFIKQNNGNYYPQYEWRTMCVWTGTQMDANCYGVIGTVASTITQLKFYTKTSGSKFNAGTIFTIRRIK